MDKEWKDIEGNSPYVFIQNDEFRTYKETYSTEFLKEIEDDDRKINNFYQKVLPGLCCKYKDKWACVFEPCRTKRVTYATKQTFLRHVQIFHKNSIPGGGLFLTPNSNYFSKHICQFCGSVFGRKDKLDFHLKNTKTCSKKYAAQTKDDSVSASTDASRIDSNQIESKRDDVEKVELRGVEVFPSPESSIDKSSADQADSSNSKDSSIANSTDTSSVKLETSIEIPPNVNEEKSSTADTCSVEKSSFSEVFVLELDEIPCGQPVRFEPIISTPDSPSLSEDESETFLDIKPLEKSTPKRSLSSFSFNGDLKKNKNKDDENKENEALNEEEEDDRLILEFLSNTNY